MPLESISNIEMFKGLTKDELEVIAAHCQKVDFRKDHLFVKEGKQISALFILLKGQLMVFLPQKSEGIGTLRAIDVNLNILHPGDCFGDYSLIDKGPASANVVATEPGQVLKISHDDLEQILKGHDHMARVIYANMLRTLTKRLREKDTEIDLLLIGR
jgi:CRP/FNR family cyclic AMP-dependent transcriptional regulator